MRSKLSSPRPPPSAIARDRSRSAAGGSGQNRTGEEEPEVHAFARARDLRHDGKVMPAGRADHRPRVLAPLLVIEVENDEAAGRVFKERIGARDDSPGEVVSHRLVREGVMTTVGTVLAVRLLDAAERPVEAVEAVRRIARAPVLARPARRVDVRPPREELPEDADLLGGRDVRLRDGRLGPAVGVGRRCGRCGRRCRRGGNDGHRRPDL